MVAASLITAGMQVPFTLNANASVQSANPPTPSLSEVKDAREKLQQQSAAIGKTKAAVEDAEARIPVAEKAVEKANAAATAAQEAVAAAREAVVTAQEQVAAQKEQVAAAQVVIDELLIEVSKLARRSYIQGGEYQTLEMIMGATDPSDFANQAVAVKRTSRANATTYERLVAAKQALKDQLAELKRLEDLIRQRQQEAEAKAAEAKRSQFAAQAAKQEVVDLANQLQAALDKAAAQLREIRTTYNEVLDRYQTAQERKAGGSTVVKGVSNPTMRSGRQVVDWAMQFIGRGASYDHLCLGFVDDAYGVTSGRMPRAIDQWYRANKAGYGHPGDRTPPVGAQVFWMSDNPARHIGVYAGGGMVITTGGDGDRVAILSMGTMDAWGPYIGWAPGYYG
jgi:cell wall-associated NlpC family hydrolase